MQIKRAADWLFKDLRVRKGEYIIGENPNISIIVFTVSMILAIISYRGFWQHAFSVVAYAALTYWAIREVTTGHSRFRKLLGILALIAVTGALLLRLGISG